MAKETARARAAYEAYAALGPLRSLAKLAATSPFGQRQCEVWSVAWGWQTRVQAYDALEAEQAAEVRRARDRERAQAREDMLDRHALRGRELFDLAVGRLVSLAQRDDIDASAAVRLLHEAMGLERLALGVADPGQVPVVGMVTLDQLKSLVGEVDAEQTQWERDRGYAATPAE
jgi:hypothetical protein